MRDYKARIEKLRKEAAECEMIANLATDKEKRELSEAASGHLRTPQFYRCISVRALARSTTTSFSKSYSS
jgi:hypothetical protein